MLFFYNLCRKKANIIFFLFGKEYRVTGKMSFRTVVRNLKNSLCFSEKRFLALLRNDIK